MRMINLSSDADKAGRFFFAREREHHRLGPDARKAPNLKSSKTTPCTVTGDNEINDLRSRRFALRKPLLRRAKQEHGGGLGLMREAASTTSAVIPREGGESSIPETPNVPLDCRGVLDRPVKPGDDTAFVGPLR